MMLGIEFLEIVTKMPKSKTAKDTTSPHYQIDKECYLDVTKAMGAVGVTGNQANMQRYLIYETIAKAIMHFAPDCPLGRELLSIRQR